MTNKPEEQSEAAEPPAERTRLVVSRGHLHLQPPLIVFIAKRDTPQQVEARPEDTQRLAG